MATWRRVLVLAAAAAACGALVQCGVPPPPALPAATPPTSSAPAAAAPPAVAPPPVPAGPGIHPVTAAELGASWRPGCPVGPDRLRRVELDYLGFDNRTHRGELIVHEALATEVMSIFAQLYRLGYPIQRMTTVEHYPAADDELSMEDNNTSAFNCRNLPGSTRWSQHAYGRAIDVNPLLNPYIDGTGAFQPRNAAPYLDRSRADHGLLHGGEPAVRAFTDRGWRWGGQWRSPVDYQHFERR